MLNIKLFFLMMSLNTFSILSERTFNSLLKKIKISKSKEIMWFEILFLSLNFLFLLQILLVNFDAKEN